MVTQAYKQTHIKFMWDQDPLWEIGDKWQLCFTDEATGRRSQPVFYEVVARTISEDGAEVDYEIKPFSGMPS